MDLEARSGLELEPGRTGSWPEPAATGLDNQGHPRARGADGDTRVPHADAGRIAPRSFRPAGRRRVSDLAAYGNTSQLWDHLADQDRQLAFEHRALEYGLRRLRPAGAGWHAGRWPYLSPQLLQPHAGQPGLCSSDQRCQRSEYVGDGQLVAFGDLP